MPCHNAEKYYFFVIHKNMTRHIGKNEVKNKYSKKEMKTYFI